MVKEDLTLLLPQIILAIAAVVSLLSIAVKRSHKFIHFVTALAMLIAFGSLFYIQPTGAEVTTLFKVDGFSLLFIGLLLIAGFFITLFSYSYFEKQKKLRREEYYVLLTVASLGAISMPISNHFISFFLSLELMSVPLYVLIAYLKTNHEGIEAGIKYLIMAAVSVAILLFGFALVYAQTGVMQLDLIAAELTPKALTTPLFIGGMAMIVAGLGFKLALFPFHFWTPDIYAGAPAPVSAFVATISKGSVFAFLIRMFYELNGSEHSTIWTALAVLSIASMLVGNWLALRQKNIKRLLAYSSIGHLGYMIVPLLALSADGVNAAIFYLTTYFVAMLGAFGIISYMTGKGRELYELSDYRGLYWSKPWVAVLMTAIMLSLAGIPLTAGFLGKFYLLLSGVGSALWLLVIVLVISSGIGLYYYLRVVVAMFSKKESNISIGKTSIISGIILVFIFVFILWLGIYPTHILAIIENLTEAA